MNAPWLWILLPGLVAGGLILWPASTRTKARVGAGVALFLGVLAGLLPIDRVLMPWPGRVVFKVSSEWVLLGRALVVPDSLRPWLMGVYGSLALWLWAAPWARMRPNFVGWALMVTVFLVSALAVRPFLYAALLVEMAVLAAIPLLTPADEPATPGVVRYLAWMTLGMPFVLLASELLVGLETGLLESPLVLRAAVVLVLGFLPWLGIAPFHSVAPLLGESTPPYRAAFVLTMTTSIIGLFALGFLEQYAWLRETPQVYAALRLAGMFMFLLGSLWAPFQPHAGRALGYAWVAENGLGILALGLGGKAGLSTYAWLMPARMALFWALALSLSVLAADRKGYHRAMLEGRFWTHPWASILWVLAWAGLAALPVTLGLWPRWHLARQLMARGPAWAGWLLLGFLALVGTGLRWLRFFLDQESGKVILEPQDLPREKAWDRLALGFGFGLLFVGWLWPQGVVRWVEWAVLHFPQLVK